MATAFSHTPERGRDGTLAVSGGRVVVEHADAGGRDPELEWEDGIVVLVDGLPPVARPCQILYGQSVEAFAPDDEPRVELFAELSRDLMAATLSVERHPGGRFRLEDQPANRVLSLRRLLVERIPCAPPTPEAIDAFLYARGITHGVREDAIARCLSGAVLAEQVAWGTRPVEPEDGELTFAAQLGTVRGGGLWSVSAGTVLATIRRAQPGTPGCTVCGDDVAVREPVAIDLELGEHVTESADGTRLISAIDGFPSVQDDRIDVAPVARLERDLDDRAGDIQGYGSIELTGGIFEGRHVRVRRDLRVSGSIEHARVEVGGSAVIGGIANGSRLQVGGMRTPAAHLLELLDPIPGELTRAHSMAGQLALAARQKGQDLAPAQAATIVVQRYFADAARALKQASSYAVAQADVLGVESGAALRDCVTVVIAIESGAAPANALPETALAVSLRVRALRESLSTPVRLVAGALQASQVELGGDLEITGRGVIGCTMEVRGDVLIEGAGSSLRGGELHVGGVARISELGSTGESPTIVRLAPGASLYAKLVHPGVTVETADGATQTFRAVERDVELGAVERAA
jgi:hypothetical protein